jgi:hypothetical protein
MAEKAEKAVWDDAQVGFLEESKSKQEAQGII